MKERGEKYSRLIGYNFGEYIYDGAYWNTETGKKEYAFSTYKNGLNQDATSMYITDYKGFRELIDQYNWPKR